MILNTKGVPFNPASPFLPAMWSKELVDDLLAESVIERMFKSRLWLPESQEKYRKKDMVGIKIRKPVQFRYRDTD